jgi:hypothetical protein
MKCKYCDLKLTLDNYPKPNRACAACRRHYEQLKAGFKGVKPELKDETEIWDNSTAYEEWISVLEDSDIPEKVVLNSNGTYTEQRCDVRDMRTEVGLPKFKPLESQVYTAWVEEGVKDNKMQEVLGLTHRQLAHVKSVVKVKLKKQMAYYLTVKKLNKDVELLKKRKGI